MGAALSTILPIVLPSIIGAISNLGGAEKEEMIRFLQLTGGIGGIGGSDEAMAYTGEGAKRKKRKGKKKCNK